MNKAALAYAKRIGQLLDHVPTLPTVEPWSFLSFDALNGGIFSDGQRVLTAKPFTHSAFAVPLVGHTVIWGADMTVDLQSFDKFDTEDFVVFTPIATAFTEDQLERAFWGAFVKYGGMGYGIMELPAFLWRGFCARCLRINTDRWHNWFPGKVICSQLTFHILEELAISKPQIFKVLDQYTSTLYDSGQQFECMMQLRDMGLFLITNKRWSF